MRHSWDWGGLFPRCTLDSLPMFQDANQGDQLSVIDAMQLHEKHALADTRYFPRGMRCCSRN
jgi:hypothetical protein